MKWTALCTNKSVICKSKWELTSGYELNIGSTHQPRLLILIDFDGFFSLKDKC